MKRRDYGDGSVANKPRQDGRWPASFMQRDGTRKYVYGRTRQEAKQKLIEAQRKAERGELVASNKQRVADYLDYWLSVHKLTIRPITERSYAGVMTKHVIPALGHIPLQRLTGVHIQRFISDLARGDPAKKKKGLASSTIHLIFRILHAALKDAIEWQLIGADPCKGVKLPREEQEEVQTLDLEQAQVLLDAVRGTNLAGIVAVALATGLRRGELLALRWSDIDLDRGILHVSRTNVYVNGRGHVETEPKTKSSRRSVVLAPFAIEALREHRKAQLKVQPGAPTRQDMSLVFCNKTGGYLAPATLDRRFRKLLERAELDPVHFHALRHSCATLLLKMRVPGKVVQEILGHSSIRTTMDKYGHVLPGMQDAAMTDLDRLLAGTHKREVI